MHKIIKDKAIVTDDWTLLKLAEGETAESVKVPAGKQIVPLNVWLAQKTPLQARSDIGVWIASDERADVLGDAVKTLPLIAVDFPNFADGRGYSIAYKHRGCAKGLNGFFRHLSNIVGSKITSVSPCVTPCR